MRFLQLHATHRAALPRGRFFILFLRMTSRYSIQSHVPQDTFIRLLHGFIMDIDASKIASVVQVNRNTVNRYLHLLRRRIAKECDNAWHEKPSWSSSASQTATTVFGAFIMDGLVRTSAMPEGESAFEWQSAGCVGIIDMRRRTFYPLDSADERSMNQIREFMSFTEARLARFRGIHTSALHLHMKECEWRFNHRNEDLFKILMSSLRREPLGSTLL